MINKVILLLVVVGVAMGAPDEDEVKTLDGYMNFTGKFKMYSGYLELQADPLINTHYVFITSQNKPQTDDVVIWLNGGPGCSGLLGFAQEIGPNMIYEGGASFASKINPYSWNNNANVLFFEAPPGVGFSVNNDKSYIYNQSRSAADNVHSLGLWYQKFPQFKDNNLWIAGQSYCGMYIPHFASALIDKQVGSKFKGVLIGNGAMNVNENWRRYAGDKFLKSHYYFGPEIQKLLSFCEYTDADDKNPVCLQGQLLADKATDLLNPYATTGICYTPSSLKKGSRRFRYVPFHKRNNPILNDDNLKSGNSPCTDDDNIINYFNKATVKKQLHVDETINWSTCNDYIGDNYNRGDPSVDLLNKLKANNVKILLYSGNTDAVVPYVETEEYIRELGWSKTEEKMPFPNDKGNLMGWKTEYDGLTYVIINGAGHMVPENKPHAAYVMLMDFIAPKNKVIQE